MSYSNKTAVVFA